MKVIGYSRVSTTKQELYRQRDKIKKYCDDNNYFLCDIIEDFGISGKTNNREGYQKLLTLSSGDCDLVVISEISRLSRQEEITETLNDMQQIVKNGLSIILLDNKDKVYRANEVFPIQDILLLTVQLYGAAQERKDIKKKNQDGKMALFKRYPYVMVDATIPYGYKKEYDNTIKRYVLAENIEESANVRKAFELVLEGMTLYKVAKYFNDRNILFRNMPATVSYFSRLLRNDLYRGIRRRTSRYDETVEPITIEHRIKPIISEDDFLRVGKMLGENNKYVSSSQDRFNPLKGLFRCRCGKAMMIKDKKPLKGVSKLVYRCSSVYPSSSPYCCTVGKDEVGFDLTNTIIHHLFVQRYIEVKKYFMNNSQRKIKEAEEVIQGLSMKKSSFLSQIDSYNQKIKDNQQKIVKIDSLDIDPTFLQTLNQNHKNLVSELEGLKQEVLGIDNSIIKYKTIISQLSNLQYSEDSIKDNISIEELSDIYHTFLSYIEYYPYNIMKGTYKVVFKSGQIIYVIVNKVRSIHSAYALTDDANINLENGDITFKYWSTSPDNTNPFEFPSCKQMTMSIHDIFTSPYIEYAAFVRIKIDDEYRKQFLEKVHNAEK